MKRYRAYLFVLCVLAMVVLGGMHNTLQNALIDWRFGWSSRHANGEIVLVAIDSASIAKIGVWPWPRQLHGDLINKLEDAGVSDIVFDVDFSSPSTPASDQAFLDALKKAGGSVVLASFKQWNVDRQNLKAIHVNRPIPDFAKNAWSAVVNVTVEPDGLVRRYPYGEAIEGKFLPSIGALLAGKYQTQKAPLWIDFSIRADTVPVVSYIDVLHGDPVTLIKLKNKKVIVGGTAVELGDHFNVPNGKIIPGVLLQVLAAESILQDRVLHPGSTILVIAGLLTMGLVISVLRRRSAASTQVIVLTLGSAAIESCATAMQVNLAVVLDTSLVHTVTAAYLVALALNEIDFRGILNAIAEDRFQRIATSLGDGLVCVDHSGHITFWNRGAATIFGHESSDMVGRPLDRILSKCDEAGNRTPFSILDVPQEALQSPSGRLIELEGYRGNGEAFPLEACLSTWRATDGLQYGAVFRDISLRKREAERMRYLAERDTLTGLANRNSLYQHLDTRIAEAKTGRSEVAVLLMDLDKFKQINDTLGHVYGDQVLCAIGKQLSSLIDPSGLVARLSGDEFAIVISGEGVAKTAETISERIFTAFGKIPVVVGTHQIRIRVSIGISIFPKDCNTAEELLGNADLALYRAKADARGRHAFFERGIRDKLEARVSLEAELTRAVEANEFELFFQPQVNLRDRTLSGAEALIRWRHPDRGLVSPSEFMPVVNTSAISDRVALWVMESGCRQSRQWQQAGHHLRLGINLSPLQVQFGDLAATVTTILNKTGLEPSLLELEVTENILLEDDDKVLKVFRRIQELGVQVAFDDFGTGYASLSYLKRFPFNRLKIDKSFVRDLRTGTDDAAIVRSTISLGKSLGLSIIAEGIESAATADILQDMGCDEAQGYYFGRPMPAQEFEHRFLIANSLQKSAPLIISCAATAA